MGLVKKYYFLDTNILLHTEGSALYGFEDNTIVITDRVIEELDNFNHSKFTNEDLKYQVRCVIREIDNICEYNEKLNKKKTKTIKKALVNKENVELKLPNNGFIKFVFDGMDDSLLPLGWQLDKADNAIIASAVKLSKEHPRTPVIIVTNDRLMKIKCTLVDIPVQEYRNDIVIQSVDDEYKGRTDLMVSKEVVDAIYQDHSVDFEDFRNISRLENLKLVENEYIKLISPDQSSSALCRYTNNKIELINNNGKEYDKMIGVKPKNVGQYFALDALLRPASEVPLVILKGCAGSGKTLLAIAAGLHAIQHKGDYGRIIITRSNTVPKNEELGALPGDERQKLSPLLGSFADNLEFLSGNRYQLDDMLDTGEIELAPMAYIRGRSISDAFIIIDEAQNITSMQAFTIISRAGINSKLVILGDATQRDNDKLTERNNGLVYASEKMKGSKLCAQVFFNDNESVRSELAKDAIERMKK